MRQLSARYFSPKSCLHHYLHMAEGNFRVREFVGALPRAPSPDLGALDALFRDALKEAWT
jgi:hypothetical protein